MPHYTMPQKLYEYAFPKSENSRTVGQQFFAVRVPRLKQRSLCQPVNYVLPDPGFDGNLVVAFGGSEAT